jgi:uncharacterized membrane protein
MEGLSLNNKKRVVSTWWLITYPLLFALTLVGIAVLWASVPDPMPKIIYSSFQQDQAALVAKNIMLLLPGIVGQLIVVIFFIGAHFLIKIANPIHIPVPKNLTPEKEAKRRYYGSVALVVVGVVAIAVMGIIQITTLMALTV